MKRVGNVTSNKLYNPRNTRPAIPIDADEVDGAMERFIRQKYESRTFQNGGTGSASPGSRQNTGSTSSDDRPPALPPKPNKRFFFPSLRSASSTVPRQGTMSPPTSPGFDRFGHSEPSPPPKDKRSQPSRFLDTEVNSIRDDGLERKIQYLKDMGFPDEKRIAQVLRGLDGNVEKAVEVLIRVGDGGESARDNARETARETARNQLPTPGATPVNGITLETTQTPPAVSRSNNPFDFPDTNKSLPPPPSSPTDRSLSPPQAYNPFMQPQQQFAQPQSQFAQAQQPSIDQAFGNMQLSQQPQPALFPNTTGGYQNTNQATFNPFLQQTDTPPVPQVPQQYSQFAAVAPFNPPQQTYTQPQPAFAAPNPFLRTSRSQNFNPNNAFDTQGPFNAYNTNSTYGNQPQQAVQPLQAQVQPQQPNNGYNPFQTSIPQSQSVFGPSSPTAQSPYGANGNNQQSYFQEPQTMQYQAPQAPHVQPSFQSPASAPPQQQSMYQPPAALPHSEPLYQQPQFNSRHDKGSILALYNMPQYAPVQPQAYQPGEPVAQDFAQQAPPQRSVTMPLSAMGANNPFGSLAPLAKPNPLAHSSAFATGGMSRESVDFAGLAMMNGRHSPDAFSGLSARMR